MKIYISGKITGDGDFLRKFNRAAVLAVSKTNAEVINPALINSALPKSTTYDQYMDMCYLMIDMADAVLMLKDWESSKGACIEYGYALASDKTIIFEKYLEQL